MVAKKWFFPIIILYWIIVLQQISDVMGSGVREQENSAIWKLYVSHCTNELVGMINSVQGKCTVTVTMLYDCLRGMKYAIIS